MTGGLAPLPPAGVFPRALVVSGVVHAFVLLWSFAQPRLPELSPSTSELPPESVAVLFVDVQPDLPPLGPTENAPETKPNLTKAEPVKEPRPAARMPAQGSDPARTTARPAASRASSPEVAAHVAPQGPPVDTPQGVDVATLSGPPGSGTGVGAGPPDAGVSGSNVDPSAGADGGGVAAPLPHPDDAAKLAYLKAIRERLAKHLRYPWLAQREGWTGTVNVRFRVRPSGHTEDVRAVSGAEEPALRAAAIETVRAADPFPPPPDAVAGLMVEAPIEFALVAHAQDSF